VLTQDFLEMSTEAKKLAGEARIQILRMTSYAKASHVSSALSVVDILSVLYSGAANISPVNVESNTRDIVLLSKGHAASALYSVLGIRNFFPIGNLAEYCDNGSLIGGHVTASGLPGIELSTGSLGHALPYGVGIALSRKFDNQEGQVFVVMSDGECDEGTTWESALLANHHNLDKLTVIIDRNRIQSLKDTEMTLRLEPFADKWKAFGWRVFDIDGHNYMELTSSLMARDPRPKVIIANTVKGKGVSFMENSVPWHYKSPNQQELDSAIEQVLNAE
jgi:transketolase